MNRFSESNLSKKMLKIEKLLNIYLMNKNEFSDKTNDQ